MLAVSLLVVLDVGYILKQISKVFPTESFI